MDTAPLTYSSAEAVYVELERLRAAGVLSDAAYRAQLNTLRIKDERERTWMLQERTGRWHVWERGMWIEASPPGREPASVSAPVAAEPGERVPSLGEKVAPPTAQAIPAPASAAPADLPPPGVVPPPPTAGGTSRLPGQPPIAGGVASCTITQEPPQPVTPIAPPPRPVQPPLAALQAERPPATVPPPSTQAPSASLAPPAPLAPSAPLAPPAPLTASTPNYKAQPAPGRAGKRARRKANRAARPRSGWRYIYWSILKWDVVWCLVAWGVFATVGERAGWALIPVGALAIVTLVLWIRSLPRRHAGEPT
ncbi:MAG: hypothetical protein R6X16_07840 [Anaerolineae bacterium]